MASRNNSIAHVTNVEHRDNVLRVTDTTMRKMSVADPNIANLTVDAKAATNSEKKMTLKQAFDLYKKAMGFSILFSTGRFFSIPLFNGHRQLVRYVSRDQLLRHVFTKIILTIFSYRHGGLRHCLDWRLLRFPSFHSEIWDLY